MSLRADTTLPEPDTPTAASLLERMRAGDRDATGDFIDRYGELIRLRVRDRLGTALRRVLDSQDVLSTVSRRLDALVHEGRLRAETERELWALVGRIAGHAVSENVRRERRAAVAPLGDACDDELATQPRVDDAIDARAAAALALAAASTQEDRAILRQWIADRPHHRLAASLDTTPAAVRMRWRRLVARARRTAVGEP